MGLSTADPRVCTVTLDRRTGIDYGCDLTLAWPYVMSMVPDGSAARSGEVQLGDQLVAVEGQSVLGLSVADAMALSSAAPGEQLALTFFRGEREALQRIVGAAGGAPRTVTQPWSVAASPTCSSRCRTEPTSGTS